MSVRNKILYLIQAWAHAFRNEPKYKVVQDTYQIMKVEGQCRPQRWVPVGQIWAPDEFIWSAGGQAEPREASALLSRRQPCSGVQAWPILTITDDPLSAGHVFPEFKESDAMFAAERVSWGARPGLGLGQQVGSP